LIQAEKLVNDATVVQVPRTRVEYWHVELDAHAVILAEGLPAESYLDTGNRTAFVNGGDDLEAYPDFKPKHWTETCVPLVLEGAAIARVKARLLERAAELGHGLTDDADLHVLVDGVRIEPVGLGGTRIAFMLPEGGTQIELRCRRYVPARLRPASTDARGLGICVNRWQLDGTDVALSDDAAFAAGWHALETDADDKRWRWSRDRVPLPRTTRLVVLEIAFPGLYWNAVGSDRSIRIVASSAG
jgi:hypothetical protein